MRTRTRRRALSMGALTATAAIVVATAAPASAHVTVAADTAAAGSYAVLTFSVPHGCDGSATTAVSIEIPDGINAVTPTRSALYDVQKVTEQLDSPTTDSHGNQVTERVSEVVYTATTPLPDGYRDAFELSIQLPEDAAGTTLYFPTVQTCESGESAWVQIPADGQSADDLELPAPSLEVTEASTGQDGATHADSGDDSDDDSDDDGGSDGIAITAVVLGALGLLAGAAAFVRSGRRTT